MFMNIKKGPHSWGLRSFVHWIQQITTESVILRPKYGVLLPISSYIWKITMLIVLGVERKILKYSNSYISLKRRRL